MPRYFFNIYGDQDIFDDTGTELKGTPELRLHMLATGLAVLECHENQTSHWQMEALDERGRIIGTMGFGVRDDEEEDIHWLDR